MKKEIWKPIAGYEGWYEVSSYGRIKSLIEASHRNMTEPFIKKLQITHKGYYSVYLTKNNVSRTLSVHRLVAKAFIPNPSNRPCVNHKDTDKLNNNVENLEWCTHKENNDHARQNGLINPPRGENSGQSVISEQTALSIIRDINLGLSHKDLRVKYPDVTRGIIYAIHKGETWTHLSEKVSRTEWVKPSKYTEERVKEVLEFVKNNPSLPKVKVACQMGIPRTCVLRMIDGTYKCRSNP